jgi:hypothetical protein
VKGNNMGVLSRDVDWHSVLRSLMNDALVTEGKSISGLDLQQNVWHYIDINNPRSPKMMQVSKPGERQKILVHYPENSMTYKDPHIDKYKVAEIFDGEIYDLLTGKKYVKGDMVEVGPMDKFKPKTTDKECYVIVEVRDKKSDIFNRPCP